MTCHLSSSLQIRHFLKYHSENGKMKFIAFLAILTVISGDRKNLSHSVQVLMPHTYLPVLSYLPPSSLICSHGNPGFWNQWWDQSCRGSPRSPSPSSTKNRLIPISVFSLFLFFWGGIKWLSGMLLLHGWSCGFKRLVLTTQRMCAGFSLFFFFFY